MAERGIKGSIVSIFCDDGARYSDTIFDENWLAAKGFDIKAERKKIAHFFETGTFAAG